MNTKNNLKKVLSVVLVLMMVVSTMVIMPLATSAAELQGDGLSEATAYQVGSLDEWRALKTIATDGTFFNKELYVKITADFDLSGSLPLDNTSYPNTAEYVNAKGETVPVNTGSIKWQIDGQGHTIGNTNVQLILGTAGGVTIRNLTVNMNQTNGEAYGAAFVGVVCGNKNGPVVIENCVANGKMNYSRSGARVAGGIVGDIYSTSPALTIRNCVNNATLYTTAGVAHIFGGILGACEAGTAVIENCINNGSVTTTGTAGGILGNHTGGKATVDGCINTGVVDGGLSSDIIGKTTGGATIKNSYTTVGQPLVGSYVGTATLNATVNENVTIDTVRAGITVANLSGATSEAWDGTTVTKPALEDESAPNSATNRYMITNGAELAYFSTSNATPVAEAYYLKLMNNIDMGAKTWKSMIGSVASDIDGQNFAIMNVTVSQTNSGAHPGFYGTAYKPVSANVTLTNLHFVNFKGSITNHQTGIISYVSGTPTITMNNVTATGKVYSEHNSARLGGFIGHVGSAVTVNLTNCINAIAVEDPGYGGTPHVGGFLGYVETASANITFTNCIFEGTIDGMSAKGGILAGETKSNITATNVFVNTKSDLVHHASWHTVTISNTLTAGAAANPANAAAVAAINDAVYGALNIAAGSGNLSTKLQLLNGYGFLLLGKLPAKVAASDAEVGFIVNGQKMAGEIADGKVVVEITDAKVATLDTDYSVALYAVINGVQSTSAVRENVLNPYDLMNELLVDGDADGVADGKYQGVVVVTNAKELEVYATMVTYYNNYKAWLEQ